MKKFKLFPGTDEDAFNKAAKGKTKDERRKLYKIFKKQNEEKIKQKQNLLNFLNSTYDSDKSNVVSPDIYLTQSKRIIKFKAKKTILDDLRDFRSSKIVSNVSNCIATFIVKCGGQSWENDTKNDVRSTIAFIISEVTNKVLEKPLQIIENVKFFIKVGKTVYKIVSWIDKTTTLLITDEDSITIVNESNKEYLKFLRKYPQLNITIPSPKTDIADMKYKVGDIVLLTDNHKVKIITINISDETYDAIDIEDNNKIYTIKETDICNLINDISS